MAKNKLIDHIKSNASITEKYLTRIGSQFKWIMEGKYTIVPVSSDYSDSHKVYEVYRNNTQLRIFRFNTHSSREGSFRLDQHNISNNIEIFFHTNTPFKQLRFGSEHDVVIFLLAAPELAGQDIRPSLSYSHSEGIMRVNKRLPPYVTSYKVNKLSDLVDLSYFGREL